MPTYTSIKKTIIYTFLILFLCNKLQAERPVFNELRDALSKAKTVPEQIEIEIQLAHSYIYINADSLKYYALRAIQKSKKINNNIFLCNAYLKYAMFFNAFPEYASNDSTQHYINLAFKTAQKASFKKGMATCYFQRGYLNTGSQAIADLLKAKELLTEIKDSAMLVNVDYAIGSNYQLAGNYEKAIEIYEQLAQAKAMKSSPFYVGLLEIIGSVYESAKIFDKSLDYYKEAYSLLSISGDKCDLHRIFMKITYAYHQLKNTDSTQHYYNKTLSYADTCKKYDGHENDCVRLADISFDSKNYKEAEKLYLKSLDIVRLYNWPDYELYTLKQLSAFYQATKKYDRALDYLQQYIHLKDSLKIEQLEHILDKGLSDQELKNKKAELIKLKKEQASTRKYSIIALFMLSILLFLIIWHIQASLLFRFSKSYFHKKDNNQAESMWNYIPPIIMPGQLSSLTIASIYAALNMYIVYLFFENNAGFYNIAMWGVGCLALFWGSERLFFSYYKFHQGLPFKKELIRFLAGLIPFLGILALTALLLKLINPSFIGLSEFLLTAAACFFIAIAVGVLFQYRLRFDIVTDALIANFNAILAERKPQEQTVETREEKPIFIEDNGKAVEINLTNLLYIVSDNVYQEFISLEGNKTHATLVRNTLGNIEKSLNEYKSFLRCHRSYIVNTKRISSIIRKSRQYYFVLDKTNEEIPISRNAENEILEKFTQYLNN